MLGRVRQHPSKQQLHGIHGLVPVAAQVQRLGQCRMSVGVKLTHACNPADAVKASTEGNGFVLCCVVLQGCPEPAVLPVQA
jgi:hypothetical protein